MDPSRLELSSVDLADLLGISRQAVSQLLQKYQAAGAVAKSGRGTANLSPKIVRKILESRGYKYVSKTIAFQIIKGGVGKTTLAKNFGIRAAQYGYKVLFIDFDHQANLTFALNEYNPHQPVWVDLLRGKVAKAKDLVVAVSDNIGLIPSSLANARIDSELLTNTHNIRAVVTKPLESLKSEYDLIICDCPPALGPSVSAVYLAVDQVIAPVVTDKFSEIGIDFMLEEWKVLTSRFDRTPNIQLLINRHDPRLKASNEQLLHLVSRYRSWMIPTSIRASADFLASTNSNQHLWEIRRNSPAAEDVDLVVRHCLSLNELTPATSKARDADLSSAEV